MARGKERMERNGGRAVTKRMVQVEVPNQGAGVQFSSSIRYIHVYLYKRTVGTVPRLCGAWASRVYLC